MSHYAVAVFHRPDQDVDDLLAPYDENMKVAPYVRFDRMEAIDWVRENYTGYADKSDQECYDALAEDYEKDEKGNLLSTYNPDSKWDWYETGGRWSGMLNANGEECDEARVGDIDFSPDQEEYEYSLKFWDVAVEHKEEDPDGRYRTFFKEEYYKNRYGDRETYARRQAQFSTFAVITPNGVWHEKGEMGWFGCSSDTDQEAADWDDHYKERFIDTADPDWILTIVDCHI